MTRVWLWRWEWACCGDAFGVGDDVDFGIGTRSPDPDVSDVLGRELAATVDAIESHHEQEFPDRVRGRVVAVHAVTHEVITGRSLRRPNHGAPGMAVVPRDGEEGPMTRHELGNGVFAGPRPSPYVIEVRPIANSAALEPARGVRLRADENDKPPLAQASPQDGSQPGLRTRSLIGWAVDIEEH